MTLDHGPVMANVTNWQKSSFSNINICKTKEIITDSRKEKNAISLVIIDEQVVEFGLFCDCIVNRMKGRATEDEVMAALAYRQPACQSPCWAALRRWAWRSCHRRMDSKQAGQQIRSKPRSVLVEQMPGQMQGQQRARVYWGGHCCPEQAGTHSAETTVASWTGWCSLTCGWGH